MVLPFCAHCVDKFATAYAGSDGKFNTRITFLSFWPWKRALQASLFAWLQYCDKNALHQRCWQPRKKSKRNSFDGALKILR